MDINDIKKNGLLVVASRIDDDFEGFDDEMLFSLSNEQYWIQLNYKYLYHYSYIPRVKIYLLKGRHYLTVDGQDQFAEVERISEIVEAIIVSDFRGWTGNTIFELDNSQTWQQSEYAYRYQYSHKPKAVIYNAGYGTKLYVEGDKVSLKRIK